MQRNVLLQVNSLSCFKKTCILTSRRPEKKGVSRGDSCGDWITSRQSSLHWICWRRSFLFFSPLPSLLTSFFVIYFYFLLVTPKTSSFFRSYFSWSTPFLWGKLPISFPFFPLTWNESVSCSDGSFVLRVCLEGPFPESLFSLLQETEHWRQWNEIAKSNHIPSFISLSRFEQRKLFCFSVFTFIPVIEENGQGPGLQKNHLLTYEYNINWTVYGTWKYFSLSFLHEPLTQEMKWNHDEKDGLMFCMKATDSLYGASSESLSPSCIIKIFIMNSLKSWSTGLNCIREQPES